MQWIATIGIREEWQQAKNGDIDIPQLVAIIVPKFRGLILHDGRLEKLLVALENLPSDADAFDHIWEQIYDWADTHALWVKTF